MASIGQYYREFTASAVRPVQPVELADSPSISVIGLGLFGAASIACLAHLGFRMVGVDISAQKVSDLRAGRSPIADTKLNELISRGTEKQLVGATQNLIAAVLETDLTLIAVNAPVEADGRRDLNQVRDASRGIGQALAMKEGFHVVVFNSADLPNAVLDVVRSEIELASGKRLGADFGLSILSHLMRDGLIVADFFAPSGTVAIASSDRRTESLVRQVYRHVDGEAVHTSINATEAWACRIGK